MRPKLIKDAYVKENNLVLDPTQLPDSTVERLPQPTGWRILLLPFRGAKKQGSIHLPDQTIEREALATVCGYVLRVGPLAYKDESKFDGIPWCKEKDWVIFGRYAGSRFKIEGGEVRILNDDEIIATISDPTDIVHM
jgi:co-chaperonin GroES (HSP10)|tara:strand:+ start:1189 stop:1599 length:411 start_codon:yes stop_codon:yes gene_type:complete